MTNDLPVWENEGVEPPERLKRDGWKRGDRPPFQYLNWQMNRTYLALKNLQETKASTNDLEDYVKNNLSNGFNVVKYGAKTDGSEDASAAIQQAIDEARANVIDTEFAGVCTVIFPAGRYRIEKKIISSPFVKLKAIGRVIFESYVANDSVLYITAQLDDPVFENVMEKDQWFRAPLINGVDGGFIFINRLGRERGNSTAIELGSRENLTGDRVIARYSVTDVAVEHFFIAIKMNHYHHYIASFDRLHLEVNTYCVVYGDENQTVVNSGENIHYNDCVFAGARTGFLWNVDGFDSHFVNCSFDFIYTIFRARRSYRTIDITGGHIEGIYERILVNESTHNHDPGIKATFAMRGTSLLIKKGKMFEAQDSDRQLTDLYFDGIEYRQLLAENLYENSFWVDENFTIRTAKITMQAKGFMLQKGYSQTSDAFVKRATVGNIALTNGKAQVSNFEVVYADGTAAVVAAPELGTNCKAITFTGTSDNGTITVKTAPLPVKAGGQVLTNFAIYLTKEPKLNGHIYFNYYDSGGVLLKRKSQVINWLGAINPRKDAWFCPDYAATDKAPAGASTVTVEYNLYRETTNGFVTKMSCFHVEI